MKTSWSRIGGGGGRLWLALGVTALAGVLLVFQGLFLEGRMPPALTVYVRARARARPGCAAAW